MLCPYPKIRYFLHHAFNRSKLNAVPVIHLFTCSSRPIRTQAQDDHTADRQSIQTGSTDNADLKHVKSYDFRSF